MGHLSDIAAANYISIDNWLKPPHSLRPSRKLLIGASSWNLEVRTFGIEELEIEV